MKKKQKISFVYFDVGGVMINNIAAMYSVAKTHGVTYEQVYELVEQHWQAGCRGDITNEEYMNVFTTRLGITHPSGDMTDFWSDHMQAITETHAFIRELSGKVRLGILSNAEHGMLAKAMGKGLIPDIEWEVIIESAKHRMIKPDPKLFALAEELAGVPAQELLFTDDVLEYVEAVKKRGWTGVQFDTKHPHTSIQTIREIVIG